MIIIRDSKIFFSLLMVCSYSNTTKRKTSQCCRLSIFSSAYFSKRKWWFDL